MYVSVLGEHGIPHRKKGSKPDDDDAVCIGTDMRERERATEREREREREKERE